MPEENDDLKIDTLIDQLKNQTALMQSSQSEIIPLSKEKTEDFIIATTGELIQRGLQMVKDLQDTTVASHDPESIEALSKLFSSIASTVESLNKLTLMDKKSKTAKELKQMDINAKKTEEDENTGKEGQLVFKGTREQIFKELLKEANVIDIPASEPEPITHSEHPN